MRLWAVATMIPLLLAIVSVAVGRARKKDPPRWGLSMLGTGVVVMVAAGLSEQVYNCQDDPLCVQEWGRRPLDAASGAILVAVVIGVFLIWRRS